MNFNNELVTRVVNLSPLGIRFKSGEEIYYSVNQQYEYLKTDFKIYRDFIIPQNDYTFWYHNLQMLTAGSRNLAGTVGLGSGDFYNGRKEDLCLSINYKVAVPFYLGGNYSVNHVTPSRGQFHHQDLLIGFFFPYHQFATSIVFLFYLILISFFFNSNIIQI